jgi:hypothetical protein
MEISIHKHFIVLVGLRWADGFENLEQMANNGNLGQLAGGQEGRRAWWKIGTWNIGWMGRKNINRKEFIDSW